ncbi:unnamed protein product [Closterium sp. Yama58-4]|nr:unnamed protein product [Closterium sp. Yama58-4]
MFSARGAEGQASKQSTPRSGLKGILRGTLSDRRMKGSRKTTGGAKQAEKQDGKKKPKATSLYKGEGVLVVEDDKRIIFYCTLCDVWAYHDASLVDHLHGKKHKRKQAEATPLTSPPSSVTGSPPWEKTSKLTPPWKLVGEGKTSAVSPSSKRKAPHSTDTSKSAGGGSKRQRKANGQDVTVTPGAEANAGDIVPETREEESDEPSRPGDFALALFRFTNLIGRRGKWEKQLLKWSDAGPGVKHVQKEELPLLADVPAEHPEELKKQLQNANDKEVSRDGDEAVKDKEPNATSAELHCTDKPAEVNADVEVAGGARPSDDSAAVPGLHEDASGRAEGEPADSIPGAAVPEAAAGVDSSGDGKAPGAVPAKRRKGALGAGAGAAAARVCFLCQLPMMEGQVVGALWNTRLKQFACSSRNRHKKFHIFHSHCIADWVVFCSAVASTSVPPALCCPLEADGTGRYGPHNALEHPRYRLAQVFDWIVAMMVARHKATLAQKGSSASSGEGDKDGGAGGEAAEVGAAGKGDATMADAEGAPEGGEKAAKGAEGASEGGEKIPEGRENVERSAGREADKGLCDEREETAAEAAPPPAPTPSQAAHSAAVTGGSLPGNEAGVQDTGAGSGMGVVAGSMRASSPAESAAEKGSEGGCRLRFADQTVQKAADAAFYNLRVLPAECLSAHLGKGKRTGTATGPKKHA